jgi:phosphoribosylformylglycinamidine synthase
VTARIGVITFPGSLDDRDARRAIELAGGEAVALWHGSHDLEGVDALVLPGGFSYGDYLRSGAIARFSPIMQAVGDYARAGGAVLGICNGFQILCEAGLLPGALMRNAGVRFLSRPVRVRVERSDTPFTTLYRPGETLEWPIAHGAGRFAADLRTLAELEAGGQVVLRYVDANPNGSANAIAGVCNAGRNVVGLMPHPERRNGALLGGEDGARVFLSMEARNATPHTVSDVRAVGGRHLRV